MAITLTFKDIEKKFNPQYWKSIDEFEKYYIEDLMERPHAGRIYYTNRVGEEFKIDAVDHWPILKEYEVWMEGYSATGEKGTASMIGKTFARNFAEACHIIECENYLKYTRNKHIDKDKGYDAPGRWDYNPIRLTVWGCRLYWSKDLAKKSFG